MDAAPTGTPTRADRAPRARRRVIGTVVLLSMVGIPLALFALAGVPHVFRRPIVRTIIAREPGGQPAPVNDPAFAVAFPLVTGVWLSQGNTVEVLANGDGTFPPLWHDLRMARRSVTVQMYYAGPGAIADSAVRILGERSRAGIEVYLLLDAFGAQQLPRRYLDSLRASRVRVAELRAVRWFTLDRASHRSHIRGIVIDGDVAYTGGFGFDDKWLGNGRRAGEWRETNARFMGPAVDQLQATFVASWAEATGQLVTGERFLATPRGPASATTAAIGTATAALVYSPSLTGSSAAERLIAISIGTARRRLYITNAYFIPDAPFVELLIAAARRGVDVRILTNGAGSDVKTTWRASRHRYEGLLANGVRIFEYRPAAIHAKTLVVDGSWSVIGTMNFDNRSLAYNDEVSVVTLDVATGTAMEALFREDMSNADEIHLGSFRRRSFTEQLLERAADVVATLL